MAKIKIKEALKFTTRIRRGRRKLEKKRRRQGESERKKNNGSGGERKIIYGVGEQREEIGEKP